MIQIHSIKVRRLIDEGLSSSEIAAQFNGRYTEEDINVYRPKEKPKKKTKAVKADVAG